MAASFCVLMHRYFADLGVTGSGKSFFEELSQRQMSYAIFVPLIKKRCGADDIFGMIVPNLFQWPEFSVACGLFRNDITCLDLGT